MAGHRLCIATLLVLVLAIVSSSSSSSSMVTLRRQLVPVTPVQNLNASVQQDSTSTNTTANPNLKSGSANANATTHIKSAPAHHAITLMSFVGPALVGMLALVLIGAVIALQKYMDNRV